MRKPKMVLMMIGLILLVGLAGAAAVRAADAEPRALPPLLAPPDSIGYNRQPPGDAPITANDGRPIAQFSHPPAEFAEAIDVYLPEIISWEDPASEAYAILASVRYSGSGHTILVTTARPSPGAPQQARALGEEAIQLAGGIGAWLSTNMGGDFPNRILFVQGDLIVTIASDLAPAVLEELAAQVEIK